MLYGARALFPWAAAASEAVRVSWTWNSSAAEVAVAALELFGWVTARLTSSLPTQAMDMNNNMTIRSRIIACFFILEPFLGALDTLRGLAPGSDRGSHSGRNCARIMPIQGDIF
jgi:hypothetical protein